MITVRIGVSSTLVSALATVRPSTSKVTSLIAGVFSFSAIRPEARQASISGLGGGSGAAVCACAATVRKSVADPAMVQGRSVMAEVRLWLGRFRMEDAGPTKPATLGIVPLI